MAAETWAYAQERDEFDTRCYAVRAGETDIWAFCDSQEVVRV